MKEDDSSNESSEITVEQLQDLLIYDDTFLDYFNEFLRLPVFSQPLEYQRLTDSFKVIDIGSSSVVNCEEASAPFMSTEKEHAKLMDWAQKYRLPLFLKTDLYRELKLSKLLMRPVEEFRTDRGVMIPVDAEDRMMDRRRTYIHGYSRLSDYSTLVSSENTGSTNGERTTNESASSLSESKNPSAATKSNPASSSATLSSSSSSSTNHKRRTSNHRKNENDSSIKGFREQNSRDMEDEIYFFNDEIPYDEFIRPGSEAVSLPYRLYMNREKSLKTSKSNMSMMYKDSTNISQDASKGIRQKSTNIDSEEYDMFFRIRSAPFEYNPNDFDFIYTNKVLYMKYRALKFDSMNDGDENESELSEEMSGIEGRQNISLNRLKEITLGSHEGMLEFREFLSNTAGKYLFDFWLECEALKDTEITMNEEESIQRIITFLRNLKDQFKLTLTRAAHSQISTAIYSSSNHQQLLFTFSQAQYDVLRRLRSYWLPRYLLHQESQMSKLSFSSVFTQMFGQRHSIANSLNSDWSIQTGLMPKLILGTNLLLNKNPMDIRSYLWKNLLPMGDNEIIPTSKVGTSKRERSNHSNGIVKRTAFQERIRLALAIDTSSGCPFEEYLRNLNMIIQIHNLKFYQETQKFRQLTKRNSDRLLRLSHAWSIVKRFIMSTSHESIGISDEEGNLIMKELKKFKTTVDNSIFNICSEYVIKKLEDVWLQYLKEDVKKFLESSHTVVEPSTPPQSLDEIEVVVEGECIVVKRKIILKNVPQRDKTWDLLSVEEKQKRRAAALELKRVTEIERKKILKIVESRLRAEEEDRRMRNRSKLKPISVVSKVSSIKLKLESEKEASMDIDETTDTISQIVEEVTIPIEESLPNSKVILDNKVMFTLFKRFVDDKVDSLGTDVKNSTGLLQEIINYFNIKGFDRVSNQNRDEKAKRIYKIFLSKDAQRKVKLPEKVENKINDNHDRPKTPILREIQLRLIENYGEVFKQFWKYETNELGIKSNQLANLQEKELQIMANSQLTSVKQGKGKTNQTAVSTKKDSEDFKKALEETSYKPLNLQILFFLRYLMESGSAEFKNGLENDLHFLVEVMKLQEICRSSVDEAIAKGKIQCISSAFFESVHPPAVQINVPVDVSQRTLRSVQRQLNNRDVNIDLFSDSYNHCFKTLLPYWAGFQRKWEEPYDSTIRPISKYRKLLERRYQLYNDIPIPKTSTVILPVIPKTQNITTFSYTMNDGVKLKRTLEKRDSLQPRSDQAGSEMSSHNKFDKFKKISRTASKLSMAVSN